MREQVSVWDEGGERRKGTEIEKMGRLQGTIGW